MALSIGQGQEYLGSNRWQWSVWLDGTQEELDFVEYVTYILDSTFHNPVRQVGDRTTSFRLTASAWGGFTLYADVRHRDGQETSIQHNLVLLYPDGKPTLV